MVTTKHAESSSGPGTGPRSGRIYIQEVTQLEISSGDVRDLIGRGGNPRYLLPRAVVRIIKQTGCYRQSQESLETKERNHA